MLTTNPQLLRALWLEGLAKAGSSVIGRNLLYTSLAQMDAQSAATRLASFGVAGGPGGVDDACCTTASALSQDELQEGILQGLNDQGPPLGATLFLIPGVGETGNPISLWADQSGLGHDMANALGGTQPIPGTGINGTATVDFNSAHPDSLVNNGVGATMDKYYSSSAFSMGLVWKYTGAINYNSNVICPQLLANADNSNPGQGVGFILGLNPGDATAIQCSPWFYDGAVDRTATASGSTGSAALPHYTVGTFGSGILTTYLDALAAVSVAGLSNVPAGVLAARGVGIGKGQVSTNQYFNGSSGVIITYKRDLTASGEVAQLQRYLKKVSAFLN